MQPRDAEGSQSSEHICNTLLQRTPKSMSRKKTHVCQNLDIWDRKARSLGPSGPMSGTSCLLPTLMAFLWVELPHVATETHFSNAASSASNYIWLKPRRHLGTRDLYLYQMFIGEAPRNDPTLSQYARCHPHPLGMHACHTVTIGILSLWALNKYHQVQQVWQFFKDNEESDHPFEGPLSTYPLENTVLGGEGPFRSMKEHRSGRCQKTSGVHFPGLQQHFLGAKSPFTILAAKTLILVASWGSQTFWIGPLSLMQIPPLEGELDSWLNSTEYGRNATSCSRFGYKRLQLPFRFSPPWALLGSLAPGEPTCHSACCPMGKN